VLARLAALLRPAPSPRSLGRAGERAAARLLRARGFRVIARNVRVPMGEADLLCLAPDRATIVLVEVKTRRRGDVSPRAEATAPEASITAHKRQKLRAIFAHLARANHWQRRPMRIDVVAVEWPPKGKPTLRHHENIRC
jgi:putative endonuclease